MARKTIGQRTPAIRKRKSKIRRVGLALTRFGKFFRIQKHR